MTNEQSALFAPAETQMWTKPTSDKPAGLTDAEINEKYAAGEQRIVTESNREKIPNFVKALEKPDYMRIRPFYQRRDRWDDERQSRLIESFIMNIPVPPLFLYERDFNKYEVMDGQQRITALKSFYAGEFKLKGLTIWPELNGRTYSTLPSNVRNGLDRRSIAYIVVLKESTPDEEEAVFMRQTVFARLNTGGVKLERQELRNSLFQGTFNDLLVELSRLDDFREAFGMPKYAADESEPGAVIKAHGLYEKFKDAEIVLRFFALRHAKHYTRGMQGFLDLYMARARSFGDKDLAILRDLYSKTLALARGIYGSLAFVPFSVKRNAWETGFQIAFYDAVVVALSRVLDHRERLLQSKESIIQATQELFTSNPEGTFTGRGNSKTDVEERIAKFSAMLSTFLS